MALFFEWFIALHDLEINRIVAGKKTWAQIAPMLTRSRPEEPRDRC